MSEESAESLQEQAYTALRKRIIFLDLKPGERLVLKDLCERLGVGRTPVRESIVRLQQEGLVRAVPQSGTYVARIDLGKAEDARFVRDQLEREAAVECCARASAADIDRIDRALDLQRRAADERNEGDFFISDNLMHQAIFIIAGRGTVWNWLGATNADLERYRWLRVMTTGLAWDNIMQEHQRIRDAIVRRDPIETRFYISQHMHMMFEEQSRVIDAYPDYFMGIAGE